MSLDALSGNGFIVNVFPLPRKANEGVYKFAHCTKCQSPVGMKYSTSVSRFIYKVSKKIVKKKKIFDIKQNASIDLGISKNKKIQNTQTN